MTLNQFIRIAKAYNALGWSIQEQLNGIVNQTQSLEDQNTNALEAITDFLENLSPMIEDADDFADRIKGFLAEPW